MNFKKATDQLCEAISHNELASALGVSVATIRQARLEPTAKAHRSPPPDWTIAVRAIAASKLEHLQKLISELDGAETTAPRGSHAKVSATNTIRNNNEGASRRPKPRAQARAHG